MNIRTFFRLIGALLLGITIISFILTPADAKPSQQTNCAEYVPNNSFEENAHWLGFPLGDTGYSSDEAASGTYSFFLNTLDETTSSNEETSSAFVLLPTISEKPDSIQFSFQYKSTQFDFDGTFHVMIANTNQQILWENTFREKKSDGWHQKTYNIPTRPLVDEELILIFVLIPGDSKARHSEVYIDDVSLQVCPDTLLPPPTPMPVSHPETLPEEFISLSQFMKSIDLADWDGDGDLDQARGRFGQNQLYEYDKTTDSWQQVWESLLSDQTWDVAWADWDDDGDPDLAVANAGQANHVYRNEIRDGKRVLELAWSSAEEDYTLDIAWGDYDDDGDPDLAVGNAGSVNRVYENQGGTLAFDPANGVGWQAPPESLQTEISYIIDSITVDNVTTSIAWGDMDNDNDLDLAVGNLGFNQLYRNDDGTLIYAGTIDPVPTVISLFPPQASGTIPQATTSVAWGDWDSDGDLDLAAGNFTYRGNLLQVLESNGLLESTALQYNSHHNVIYENDHRSLTSADVLTPSLKVGSVIEGHSETISIAWADWEHNGRLGLAFGNLDFSEIYRNRRFICYTQDGSLYEAHQYMELAWRSSDRNPSSDIAWGDINANSLLDLFSAEFLAEETIFKRDLGQMQFIGDNELSCERDNIEHLPLTLLTRPLYPGPFGWSEPDDHNEQTYDMAWGDIDGDGDLDVVYGNNGSANRIYINQNGDLIEHEDIWMDRPTSGETSAVELGDLDSDGDLDLVVGNEVGSNEIYEYVGGHFRKLDWAVEMDETYSLALGDWDGDSDIDIAVGNAGENFVYENDCTDGNCVFKLDPDSGWGWRSGDNQWTDSLAWGDWDNDGDLDLAAGNRDGANVVYENVSGALLFDPDQDRGWQSHDTKDTRSLDWGDWDGDGDLDLAVGNSAEHNQVFENENGTLQLDVANDLGWQSPEKHRTVSVDWGDPDNDKDLDLLIINRLDPDYIYVNNNRENPLNKSIEIEWLNDNWISTNEADWVDWDKDGDLDIAFALHAEANSVAENYTQDQGLLPDSPPTVSIDIIGDRTSTPKAEFQATSILLKKQILPIEYTLTDINDDPVSVVRGYFSLDGGGTWQPATPTENTVLHNLAATSDGTQHTYYWHAGADMIKSNNVIFRIEVSQGYGGVGPYQVAYSAAQSFSFQLQAAKIYAKVVDVNDDPVAGATLLVNGQELVDEEGTPIQTDSAGLARLDEDNVGQSSLVALLEVEERPTARAGHDEWAYRTYLTSQAWENDIPQAATISAESEQRLVISSTNPLVLFNVVISIEWDATPEYMQQVADAMSISATNYLYDLTDGQMAFGEVSIYDNGNMQADADIQILARNNVRPHARVGGMYTQDGSIRLGRFWNGSSSSQGTWNQPAGYRTIVHEFSHYALNLYDEYIGYEMSPEGRITGLKETNCTGLAAHNPNTDETNASAMYYHYTSSEFSDEGIPALWSTENCLQTAQWYNHEMSPWRTIADQFQDQESARPWQIQAPSDRGYLVPGPENFPRESLGFPHVTISNIGTVIAPSIELTVTAQNGGHPVPNAVVVLYKDEGALTVNQGLTLSDGKVEILGAESGDEIHVITLDGALSGRGIVQMNDKMTIPLR